MAIQSTTRCNQVQQKISWLAIARKSGMITLGLVFILLFVSMSRLVSFPITNVKVFGIQHVNHNELKTLIDPFVGKGFFNVNIGVLKERILQLSWVADVMVQRVWPDKVIITISEKTPLASWNGEGLLSATGEVFTPQQETYPAGLPEFVGPSGEQITMAEYYARMNAELIPLHFRIAKLELSPSMLWTVTLSNGIKLNIGHKDILTRINHFVKVYPKIVGARAADVEYIDLQYPNGMAVRWKTVT
ncbi:MAG: cell division protein FtsQ/DivIB [Gammaproteobacteria bacterium]|nr:cell division protein FtsQ/DivIB [Gammaproteobacteria bacterium]